MRENFSTQREISWTGCFGGSGGWPWAGGGGSSREISAISTNSNSNTFFATRVGSRATALNGPFACRSALFVSCFTGLDVGEFPSGCSVRAGCVMAVVRSSLNIGSVAGRPVSAWDPVGG